MSASVKLSARTAREVLSFCEENVVPRMDAALRELRAALAKASRASATRRTLRKPKEAKQKSKREARAEVRALVVARAGDRCEACGQKWPGHAELDHFFGRARGESLETAWALCWGCHRSKTDNDPSSAWWLRRFAGHCDFYRYTEAEARARKRLAWVEARGAP